MSTRSWSTSCRQGVTVGNSDIDRRDEVAEHEVVSPVTGRVIDRVRLASREEILRAVAALAGPPSAPPQAEVRAFLDRLHEQLVTHQDTLVQTTILETGFILSDSRDIVAATIAFVP